MRGHRPTKIKCQDVKWFDLRRTCKNWERGQKKYRHSGTYKYFL